MQAVVYDEFEARPELQTVPDPRPSPTGVVLEVDATGLCRSDWHGWKGHDPIIDPPHVPGHEVSGTIVEVGADVVQWSVGQQVTVPFVGGCGQCRTCRSGNPQVCSDQYQPGFSDWGTFAEFVSIEYADANLVELPDGLDPVAAASLGCRFATAFRAVVDQSGVRGGDWVAVHGCGGVGLSAVMIARAVGARVVAVDVSKQALTLAETVGATETINARAVPDVVEAVRSHTNGGAHVSIDALGSSDTCFHSVAGLRTQGRHIQIGLLVGEEAAPRIPMDQVVAKELELRGTHGIPAHRYPALLNMIDAGSLEPERLIRRTIPLSKAGSALTKMAEKTTPGVTVITVADEAS